MSILPSAELSSVERIFIFIMYIMKKINRKYLMILFAKAIILFQAGPFDRVFARRLPSNKKAKKGEIMKKILSIGVALAMSFTLCGDAFAQNTKPNQNNNNNGGIDAGTAAGIAVGAGLLGAAVGAMSNGSNNNNRHYNNGGYGGGHRYGAYDGGDGYRRDGYRGDGYRGGRHGYGDYSGGGRGGYGNNYMRGAAGTDRRLHDWEVPRAGSGRTVMAPASVAASDSWTGCRPYRDRFGQSFQRCCKISGGVRTCYGHW